MAGAGGPAAPGPAMAGGTGQGRCAGGCAPGVLATAVMHPSLGAFAKYSKEEANKDKPRGGISTCR